MKKWKPEKRGEEYWYLTIFVGIEDFDFEITMIWYNNDHFDKYLLSCGNCFPTRKVAETKLKQIKKILKGE